MKNLINRIKSFWGFGSGEELSDRGPFFGYGELGGIGQYDPLGDGWQRNMFPDLMNADRVAVCYACIMLYARALSQCHPQHMVRGADGGDTRQTKSPEAKILRDPNHYETWPQFITGVVTDMMFKGEAMAIKVFDDRGNVSALHRIPRGNWSINVEPETRTIFYGVNAWELFHTPDYLVPQSHIIHWRTHSPRHPLMGESPIRAAAMAMGITVALNKSQLAFFTEMSRPSGVLSTESMLTKDQTRQLREAFAEQSKSWQQGGTPILSSGLKFQPVNISQSDSELIEQQKLSALDICRVFGVPAALLSDSSGTMGGTESMISLWLSIGLGSLIENIERTLDRAFDFDLSNHIQLSTDPLLRVDFAKRIDGWNRAVQAGIVAPNEVRLKEGFSPMEGGSELVMQRQMTPLNILTDLARADLENKIAKNEEIAQSKDPEPAPPPPDPEKEVSPEQLKAATIIYLNKKRAANDDT